MRIKRWGGITVQTRETGLGENMCLHNCLEGEVVRRQLRRTGKVQKAASGQSLHRLHLPFCTTFANAGHYAHDYNMAVSHPAIASEFQGEQNEGQNVCAR